MNDFVMSISCEGVLMKALETCMQQGGATSLMTIGAPCNADLSTIEIVQLPFKDEIRENKLM